MHSISTQDCGYIVWLDFTRVEGKEEFDLLSRPKILPFIPPDDQIKSDDSRCKKLVDAAKTIASVAQKMVHDWSHNTINKDRNRGRSILEATGEFQNKVLHISEYEWYKKRNTWEKVIENCKAFFNK
jgi:hypothetical protein